ncbi:hypothetical protein OA529_04375, partial [Alphaproteobacteria bacterium]|nr:hypothetical protein [Alphaproteobacteria bacterium]
KFYAIHFIASLVDLGYEVCNFISLKDNRNFLIMKFCNKKKPDISVNINIRANFNIFSINIKKKLKEIENICEQEHPFIEHSFPDDTYDTRVNVLRQHLEMKNYKLNNLLYNLKVIRLWENVESLEKKI